MSEQEDGFGFAPEHDQPIPYMQRIRDYYQTLGYGAPYRWAHYAEVPFAPLTKPLGECRIALVTTAAPYQPGKGEQGPGAAYNAATKFYTVYSGDSAADHDLRIAHVGYDRAPTTAEDSNTWFPRPPRTTGQPPVRWSDNPDWKLHFSNIARLSPEEIARRRAEFDRQKEVAKTVRDKSQAAE